MPREFWSSQSNRKLYFEWLKEKLCLKSTEDWYQITINDVNDNFGKSLLSEYYGGSLSKALLEIYSDYKWIQSKCVMFLTSNDLNVKRLAITCLGHVARIHKNLDKAVVIPLLEKLRSDKYLGGTAEDALNDIEIFLK